MNPSEFLSREIIRPLITLAIPGGVAIAPYVYLLHTNATVVNLWENHETALIFFLLVISLAVGLLLEDIGSEIENFFFDCIEKNDPTWNKYLKKPSYSELKDLGTNQEGTYITETNKDYISSIVLRLKFELGMFIAIVFAIPGLVLIMRFNCQELLDNYNWIIGVILLLMPIYLLIESRNSVYLLHTRRKNILEQHFNLIIINETIINEFPGRITNGQITGQITVTDGQITGQITGEITGEIKDGQITGEITVTDGQITGQIMSRNIYIDLILNTIDPILKLLWLIISIAVLSLIVYTIKFWINLPSLIYHILHYLFPVLGIVLMLIAICQLKKVNHSILSESSNLLKNIFFFIFLIALVLPILSSCIIPVTTLCIAHPTLNTKFLMSSSVPFEGKAYGNIEKVRLLEGNKFLGVGKLKNNQWNFNHKFKNLGNKQITIQGIQGKNVITERQVTITIVDP